MCIYENFPGESIDMLFISYQSGWDLQWSGVREKSTGRSRVSPLRLDHGGGRGCFLPSATWGEGPTFWTPVADLCPHPHAVPSSRIGPRKEQRVPKLQTRLCCIWGNRGLPLSFRLRTVSLWVSRYQNHPQSFTDLLPLPLPFPLCFLLP